jgi:hypothetical protein
MSSGVRPLLAKTVNRCSEVDKNGNETKREGKKQKEFTWFGHFCQLKRLEASECCLKDP